jgi:hypothetical protein
MPAGAAQRGDPATSATTTTTTTDPQTAMSQNEKQRDQVGGQIGSLRTSDAQVKNALTSLDAKLSSANAALASATAAAQAAQANLAAAEAAEKAAQRSAATTKRRVKKLAVDAFVNPDTQGLVEVLASANPGDAQERQSLLQIRAHRQDEILAQRRAALANVRKQHQAAKDAAASATAAATTQQQAIGQIQTARNQQTQLVGDVEQRLNAALGEAAGLDATHAQLANQITQQQEQLRAEVLSQQAIIAAVPTPTTAPASTPKSGSKSTPSTTTTTTPPRVVPPALYTLADMQLVGGIYVNHLIATQVQNLLNAARIAGLILTGGGYRDPQTQIQTRIQNCGSSDYAIYDEPASQCTPPTARPGTSMHEQGMAIDFDCNGTLIESHTDPCWIWLNQNAATYGLYNLASEPWHWSINGS